MIGNFTELKYNEPMSLTLSNPDHNIQEITQFIYRTFEGAQKKQAVIAVSGGIDSALALSLLVKTLGVEQVTTVLLPHHLQPMDDAYTILQHLKVPENNIISIDVKPLVDAAAQPLGVAENDLVRSGNLKARMRMICVFDIAKRLEALVCGTENKSEHYLGYFTRFGDAASDLEPLAHLYKAQVRQLAEFLQLPKVFLEKPPSAGLWIGQTDEQEMGFSYEQADQVLEQVIDLKKTASEIKIENISSEVVQKVVQQVQAMQFKREVPYLL